MDYLHYDFAAGAGDVIEVTLDHAANVQLLDQANYDHYRNGRPFRYRGGYVKESPYLVKVPNAGQWHVVIDLGGASGRVKASARVVRASAGATS